MSIVDFVFQSIAVNDFVTSQEHLPECNLRSHSEHSDVYTSSSIQQDFGLWNNDRARTKSLQRVVKRYELEGATTQSCLIMAQELLEKGRYYDAQKMLNACVETRVPSIAGFEEPVIRAALEIIDGLIEVRNGYDDYAEIRRGGSFGRMVAFDEAEIVNDYSVELMAQAYRVHDEIDGVRELLIQMISIDNDTNRDQLATFRQTIRREMMRWHGYVAGDLLEDPNCE